MRRSLGTAVFSGMLGVTLFGVFLTPVFFYVIQWFGHTDKPVPVVTATHTAVAKPAVPPAPVMADVNETRPATPSS